MAIINTYPDLTSLENADLVLAWEISPGRVVNIALSTLRDFLNNGAISTVDDADLTASRALVSNGSGKIAVASVTSTELGYVAGVTSALQTQLNAILTRPIVNLLFNGDFNLYDLGTSATGPTSDNVYIINGWRWLRDNGISTDLDRSRQTSGAPTGSKQYLRLTLPAGTATPSAAIFFVLNSHDAIPLQDKTVSFRCKVKNHSTPGGTIVARVAIVSWTGTADTATADPISAWADSPTFIANYTLENTPGSGVNLTASWQDLQAAGVVLNTASINNIGVLLYFRNTGNNDINVDIAQVQLAVSDLVTDFVHRPIEQERQLASKNNWEATGAPGVGDDIADGYGLMSQWVNVTADDHYVCLDPAEGAAVWKKTTP